MKPKTKHLFLTYANTSLRHNPENLQKIFKQISQAHNLESLSDFIGLIEMTIKNIVEFAKCDTPEIAREKLEYVQSTFPKVMSGALWIDCAFEAVFGYLIDHNSFLLGGYEWGLFYDSCGNFCFDKEERIAAVGKKYFVGKNRVRCHECDQLFFINIMDKISKGYEYSQIKEFRDLILDATDNVKWFVDIVNDKSHGSFKDQLLEVQFTVPGGFMELATDPFLQKERTHKLFKNFIYSFYGFSLIVFLLKNDRRKLKRCPYCNNFFVANSINRKTRCYDPDCEKAYQRDKKRKQREKEPDIYY